MAKRTKKRAIAKKRVLKRTTGRTQADFVEAARIIRLREEGFKELKLTREMVANAYQILRKMGGIGADVRAAVQDFEYRLKDLDAGQMLHKLAETERRLGRLEGLLKDLPAL